MNLLHNEFLENKAMNLLHTADIQIKYGWSVDKARFFIKDIKTKFSLTYPYFCVLETLYLKYFEQLGKSPYKRIVKDNKDKQLSINFYNPRTKKSTL